MTAQMSAMRNHVLEIEKQVQKEAKAYVHYNHTEPCNGSRWTAKECFEYMYARPWEEVNNFYSECVSGRSLLQELFGAGQARGLQTHDQYDAGTPLSINKYSHTSGQPDDQHGKWARVTFKIVISYLGKSFDGWQKQPSLVTVQGLVERSIGRFVDDMKAERLKEKGLPVEGMVVVAGRTDKGVTALHQVCSFYTWRKDIKEQEIEDAVNNEAPGKLRVVSVSQVSRTFHPNFCAKWRRYLYIFPLLEKEEGRKTHQNEEERKYHFYVKNQVDNIHEQGEHSAEDTAAEDTVRSESELVESSCFSVTRVDQLLRHLEEKLLSYKMFARDTKASRNIGPATECYIHHARAAKASMPCLGGASTMKVMCVELVANRFLRKMVRVLVATAIREAAAGAEDDILLKLMDATCRRATAPPAPPDGLCLFDVGYEDFDRRKCFIG